MKKIALFALVAMMGVLSATAGTLGVAQFNDRAATCDALTLIPTTNEFATFLTLKNNTGATVTYTIQYFTLTGTSRGPTGPNTFAIGPNAARVWRPVQTDTSGAEGPGTAIPNADGSGGAGTASILYPGSNPQDVSGRALTTARTADGPISYAWSLIP